MGGDYTRFSFNADKNHSGVLKQQGRVSLDADWNELAEIEDRRWRSETMDIVGRCVVPATTPDAFRVIPTGPGAFDIGIGRAYVDGIQAECHGLAPKEYDPILGEERGTLPVPYNDQPYYPTPLPPALATKPPSAIAGRTDLIYIDVWQREVTAIEDPALKEIALGGPDTTTRIQTAWQVKAIEDVGEISCFHTLAEWDTLTSPSAGRLTTSTHVPPADDDPCSISPAGGYRGLENRLYRVEIHTPGGPGTAAFKWSRNNASIVSGVTAISASGDRITVDSIGRDDMLRFNVGDWVEITDDHLEFLGFQGQPGHMGKVTEIDEANTIITIDTPIATASMLPSPSITDPDARAAFFVEHHTRMRRWDQSTGVDAQGLIPVPALATDKVDIEDGIQVSFDLDTAVVNGEFKVGDYWVFHARTADGSVAPLDNAPPRGIKHHYCRLATVTWGATVDATIVDDCRTIWPPASCCPITVRPGEDIQAAIDRVPEDGGCICLLPGIHRIYRPLLIDGRENITITGVGQATKVVFARARTEAMQDLPMLNITGASRDIELRSFLMHADILRHVVFVDQSGERITLQALTMINACYRDTVSTDGILLGECCNIGVFGCRILAIRGIVQADRDTLTNARTALASVYPVHAASAGGDTIRPENLEDDDAEETESDEVATIQRLKVQESEFFTTEFGVHLQDVLGGEMVKNTLRSILPQYLLPFSRCSMKAINDAVGCSRYSRYAGFEDFYAALDDKLDIFSPCRQPATVEEEQSADPEIDASIVEPAEELLPDDRSAIFSRLAGVSAVHAERPDVTALQDETDIPEDSVGVYGCMIEDFSFCGNRMTAGSGIEIAFSRLVRINDNQLTFSRVGVVLSFGFDASMEDNVLRQITPDDFADEESVESMMDCYGLHFRPGLAAIRLRFARGLKVNRNTIDSHTAISLHRFSGEIGNPRKDSLLRILRIEHLFRVIVELSWFLYNLFYPVSGENDEAASTKTTRSQSLKEGFEEKIFDFLIALLNSSYLPGFVGKAEIDDNRMAVTRFGVFFYKILTIGGLRITGNRISGFRKTGIFVHPWFSFGPVDTFARWTRCLIVWFVLFIQMLRDALQDTLEGTETADQPSEGIPAGVFLYLTQGVSWIMALCSRYCQGAGQPHDEETEEDRPPTLAEELKDALDEFLGHVNRVWIDDLVNPSYRIDANTLGGFGNGIWTGLESSGIANNDIAIRPQSPIPHETVILGVLLKASFENIDVPANISGYIQVIADGMMDLDRDSLISVAFIENRNEWLKTSLENPTARSAFHDGINTLGAYLHLSSPLYEPVTDMRNALASTPPDLSAFQQAWIEALNAIIQHMTGFGISMLGANMTCDQNRVVSHIGCGDPFSSLAGTSNFATRSNIAPLGAVGAIDSQLIAHVSGIGGIYQFSNLAGLMIDLVLLFFSDTKQRKKIYDIIAGLIVMIVLLFERDRRIGISGNRVENALVHGIRTLPVYALKEIDILDNFIENASRCGTYHAETFYTFFTDNLHLKIHRNTPKRSDDSSVFQGVYKRVAEFGSLFFARNEGGTTLMSNNHGDGNDLNRKTGSAVTVESDIAGILSNHILTEAVYAFKVTANSGLFTGNMTNKPNDFPTTDISQPPNLYIS